MTGIFSKFKTIFTKNSHIPVIAPANHKQTTSTSKASIISGCLFILSILLLAGSLTYYQDQMRQNSARLEITARIQTHLLRLRMVLQPVFSGHQNAFKQLDSSHERINQYLTLLSEGGDFRQNDILPVNQANLLTRLEDLTQQWQPEQKNIQLILNHQHTLANLGHAVNTINAVSSELNHHIEQLIAHLKQINLPDALGAITSMRTLAQNVTRSVSITLSSKLPISEIKKQLSHDRKQFSAILQAFKQGHDIFNLSSTGNNDISELLSLIQTTFIKINDNINTIETEISDIVAAKSAAGTIHQNSDKVLSSLSALDKAFQINDVDNSYLIAKINQLLIITAALSLCGWMYFLYQNKPNSAQPENTLDTTQSAMLTLLDDMKKMADGDLTVRTPVTEDITGAIADAVNFTIEQLHTLVEQVNKATALVVNASDQAQHVSSQLLSAAQQQSLKIENTTVTILDMAESINQVSDTATESTEVAKQALITAEKGSTAVRESVAGMEEIRTHIQETSKRIKRLGESTQAISEIIALVSDITEQTNILALNAALQASAAGEAGHGFNMVAQEIQHLAKRSAEASEQISRHISMIQHDTHDTIAAMERSTREVIKGTQKSTIAGKALEEIETVSKRLADYVAEIYSATHTQTQTTKRVIENMEDILHITRQATNGTQQTTESIEHISGFTTKLKASVANFKI